MGVGTLKPLGVLKGLWAWGSGYGFSVHCADDADACRNAPEDSGWIHEIKYDGYRTQIIIDAGGVRAFSRRGIDWTSKYGTVVEAAASLPVKSAIIDGEMIAPDVSGASDFSAFRKAIKGRPASLALVAFDLLHLDGEDLRAMPLVQRRALLWGMIAPANGAIQFSQHVTGGGRAFFQAVDGMGLEGMVSKRPDSEYRSGRTEAWLKTKCFTVSEYEVAAVLAERGKPTVALMVDPEHNYVGGAFITNRDIKGRLLARVRTNGGPLPKGLKPKPDAQWLEPGIMATVQHLRGEEDLRHASVKAIRD